MSRKLKTLGLALLAVFAISAIAAQGASATDHTFTSDANNTDLTGENVGSHVLESGAGAKFTCSHVTFTGTQAGSQVDQIRLTPSFSGCKIGGGEITFDDNGCEYVFESDTNDDGHAAVDLDCDHSGSITITGPACTIHFSDTHIGGENTVNQDLTGVKYVNHDGELISTDDITVDFTIAGTRTEGTGVGCTSLGLNGTKSTSVYSGKATVRGYTDGSDHGTEDHVGIRIPTAGAETTHTFTSDAEETDLTGENTGNHIIESGSGSKLVCSHVTFTGTQTGPSADQLRLTPAYSGCKLAESDVTVHDNGCEYVLDSDTTGADHAALDLDCDHSGSITITGPSCTIHFSDTHTGGGDTVNQDLTGVKYVNHDGELNSTDDVTVDFAISGIKSEGTGLGCVSLGFSGTKTSTTYDATTTISGSVDVDGCTPEHTGIRLSTP